MSAYAATGWSDLFVATAGACAALTGLVFVAVSINIEPILKSKGLPERALETLVLLLGALVVSILALVPVQGDTALGIELLVLGVLLVIAVTVFALRSLQEGAPRSRRLWRLAIATVGTVPFAIGGVSLLVEAGGGRFWLVTGIVGAILGAVLNAWVLLVEILR